MLLIGELLAQYGLSIADVATYAGDAVAFGEAYAAIRNYVIFTSLYRQTYARTTRQQADLAWRLGKWWFTQGAALSQIDPSQVIPRSLARVESQASDTLGVFSQYNYLVQTGFEDPRTGTERWVSVMVASNTPLSLDEAYAQAYAEAIAIMERSDPWNREDEGYKDTYKSQNLYSFTRYERTS